MNKKYLILIFILMLTVNLFAEIEATGTIIITSTKTEWDRNVDEYPGNVSIIDKDEIKGSTVSNLAEVLLEVEGISMTDTSGFGLGAGLNSIVNLRGVGGGDKTSTITFLHGVKLNNLSNNSVAWKAIPMSSIQRIEVLKAGSGGISYGEGSLSGVINIVTQKPTEKACFDIFSASGDYGQNKNSFLASGKSDVLGYVVTVDKEHIDGYRQKSSYDGETGSVNFVLDLKEKGEVDLFLLEHKDTTESPGSLTKEEVHENRRQKGAYSGKYLNKYSQLSLGYKKIINDEIELNSLIYKTDGENNSNFGSLFENSNISLGANVSLKIEKDIFEIPHTCILGSEVNKKEAISGSVGSRKSKSDVEGHSFYLQESLYFNDSLTLEAGYRFDKAVYDENLTWPVYKGKLEFEGHSQYCGLAYEFIDNQSLFFNYSKTFKMPAIEDIDAVAPNYNDNIELDPQKASTYELGFNFLFAKNLQAKVSGFMMKIDDEILYNNFVFKNVNFNTKRKGAELFLKSSLFKDKIVFKIGASYLEAKFDEGLYLGNYVSLVPKLKYHLDLKYKIIDFLTLNTDWFFVKDQYRVGDLNNIMKAENYDVLNTKLEYEKNNFVCYFMINNLLNKKYSTFQSSDGVDIVAGEYPMPEQNFVVGINFKFWIDG